jgi:hypothetical protein
MAEINSFFLKSDYCNFIPNQTRMKKFAFIFLICFTQTAFAQNNNKVELEKTIENSFQEIWSELDETQIGKFYTTDFTLFEDGQIYNIDSVRNVITGQKQQFGSDENKMHKFGRNNRFEFIESSADGNTGWISYRNFAEFTMDGTPIANVQWLESAILIRTEEGWKIRFLHSTMVKD